MNKKFIIASALLSLASFLVPPKSEAPMKIENKLKEITISKKSYIKDNTKIPKYEYKNIDYLKVYPLLISSFLEMPDYITKDFLEYQMDAESGGNPKCISNKDARGLMQVTREAWEDVEKKMSFDKNSLDPIRNVYVAGKYIIFLHEDFENSHPRWNELSDKEKRMAVAAAYNGGPERLKKKRWDISKMPEETRDYVRKIEKRMENYSNFK